MRSVIYVSSVIPEALYREGIPEGDRSDTQAQRFHRSLIAGLRENSFRVLAFSSRAGFSRPERDADGGDGVSFRFASPGAGHLSVARECYRFVCDALRANPDAFVLADVLSLTVAAAAALAAKRCRRRSYGIVTDVPGIYETSGNRSNARLNRFVISLFGGYLFLTAAMGDLLNRRPKPSAVMEGLYNPPERELPAVPSAGTAVVYAGSLHRQYGIATLVSAFRLLPDPSLSLLLFGTGDYVPDILSAAEADPRINYFGVRDNATVLAYERGASLLVNPRSENERFTRYSFPSKTIEYMSTGTPVLMQALPGMPEEYKPHLYLYRGDTPAELAAAIASVLGRPAAERTDKGEGARAFILGCKGSAAQVRRALINLKEIPE